MFEPGEAKARPFRTEEGRAYGPGVADAKGGAAIILGAIKVLNELDFDGYGEITVPCSIRTRRRARWARAT